MRSGLELMVRLVLRHWVVVTALMGQGLMTAWRLREARRRAAARRRERWMREELEAYAGLETRIGKADDIAGLGKRVCRMVAEKSAFPRVGMLVRDADGKLFVAASAGMDDRLVKALNGWCERVLKISTGMKDRGWNKDDSGGVRMGTTRFGIQLRVERDQLDEFAAAVTAIPFWNVGGRMVGALVVGERAGVNMRLAKDSFPPLEALAVRLARMMENVALAERLLRAEKLAGLGQLAGGVAHALNNPLTAVLGFAELISESSSEPRIRQDAVTIVREALRMRDTVQSLMNFWRPVGLGEQTVSMKELLEELAASCATKLEGRGVKLLMQVAEDAPEVRGDKERLRQVMEHLLNNAVQATPAGGSGDEIRIAVSHDEATLHVIVSDSGPGFEEPGRVFEPFYTTRQPGQGEGLGLSICYGIVREHGGEISAFNLHPHGAAVVVELPVSGAVVAGNEAVRAVG